MFLTLQKNTIVLLALITVLTALTLQSEVYAGGSGKLIAARRTDGAVIYKLGDGKGGNVGLLPAAVAAMIPANMPHTPITGDVPDLRAIGYNDNILFIELQGSIRGAAVYTDINYQGDCETVTTHRSQTWRPSNTVLGNISSIRLNYTCGGASRLTPVLTDVTSIDGASDDVRCPSGYTRRNQDLNAGAGGRFVYLCLQYGPQSMRYVRGLSFGKGAKNDPACSGDGYHWTGDLKAGTKKAGVYLCVNNGAGSANDPPLIDVDFVAQTTPFNPFSDNRPCEGKLGLPRLQVNQGDDDLNQGLGGKYIYMCTGLSRAYER